LKSHPDLFLFFFYKLRRWCGLCKMDILVIVTVTISKSFQIIFRHTSNSNSKLFLVVYLAPFHWFFIFYIFNIFLHLFNVFFSFEYFLWTYLMNFIGIFPSKSAKKALMEQNDIKWNL
jgi:hypothetical protein